MNIAILDFTMSKTHVRLNISNFQALSKMANLYVVNGNHYYDGLQSEDSIVLLDTHVGEKKDSGSRVLNRLAIINNMKENLRALKQIKSGHIDYILIMGYEIITFALMKRHFLKIAPVFLFQHQQIDELRNRIKKIFFDSFKNEVAHIVYEEQFKKFLQVEQKVNNVYVVPYIGYVRGSPLRDSVGQKRFFLGISSNNDDIIVDDIINLQRSSGFLTKTNSFVYIRSKKRSYKDDNLFVGYEYLEPEAYDKLFRDAYGVLALVPNSFVNRLSGPLMDALIAGKRIVTSNKSIYNIHGRECPSMFRYISSAADLANILEMKSWSIDEGEINRMVRLHSLDNVSDEYKTIFLDRV